MSHGGMGGGGGHGHHGGHHGGVGGGHHADQSPTWNMAMQTEKDNTKRLIITDPRFVVGVTLFVFVSLISLPYTLDFFQSHGGNATLIGEDDGAKGPNAAALSMVGGTLLGGGLHAPERSAGGLGQASQAPVQSYIASPAQQVQAPAGIGEPEEIAGDNSHDGSAHVNGREAESPEMTKSAESESQNDVAAEANSAPSVASQSAQETVAKMLAASGMATGNGGNQMNSSLGQPPAAFGMAGQAQAQLPAQAPYVGPQVQAPAQQQAQMPAYGGAVPQSNNQYYVYIPNQQFGQPAASPEVYMPAAGQQLPQQLAVVPQSGSQTMQSRQAYESRSPFNPQTSAISSPLGMRHRNAEPTVPMVPTSTGTDGNQRFRVWVNR